MAATVQLFVTCLIDSLFPEVGEAVVEVLERAGAGVEFPAGQTCCGQPAFNAGERDAAARMARRTIEVLEAAPGDVVIPSGSCAAMIRRGYLELFADDRRWRSRAQALAGRVFEFSEYLVDHLERTDLGAPAPGRLAYHPSCHLLRELGVDRQPRALLAALPGPAAVGLEADCCGFGGVFAVAHPEVSAAMLARKLEAVRASRAERVVGCDVSCLMQIEGGLRRTGSPVRCAHLAQVLAGREGGLR